MKKHLHRGLAWVLTLCLVFALLPALASAAENKVYYTGVISGGDGDLTYKTNVTVEINLSDNTAVATFTRGEIVYNDRYDHYQEIYKRIMATPSGTLHYKNIKKLDDSKYEFALISSTQVGDPYIINNYLSSYHYPSIIYINKPGATTPDGDPAGFVISGARKLHTFFVGGNVKPQTSQEKEKFIFGEDNFSFPNAPSSFFSTAAASVQIPGIVYAGAESLPGTNGYNISPASYETLTKGLSNSEIAAVNGLMNRPFFGNCFGMSVTAGLIHDKKLDIKKLDSNAKNTYGLPKPVNNAQLREAIVYYQLSQQLGNVAFLENHGQSDSQLNLALVTALKSALPSSVVFGFTVRDGGESYGHASLAYDVESTNSAHKIKVYDPNNPYTPLTLTISADGKSASFDSTYNNFRINNSIKTSALSSAPFNSSLKPPALPEGSAVITANTDTLTITADGKSAEFVDGKKLGGNLDAKYLGFQNDKNGEPSVKFYINPPNRNGPILNMRVSGSKPSSQKNLNISVHMISQSYTEVFTSGGCDVIIEKEGSVLVNQTSANKLQVGHASNKTSGKLFSTTVTTTGSSIKLTPSASGTTVKTEDATKADITVSGAKASVSFQDVNTTSPVDITSSDLVCHLVSDGNTLAEGTADEKGGAYGAPVVPDAAANDITVISYSVKKASASNANKIIDVMKNSEITSKSYANMGYPHSIWARVELSRAQMLGLIPSSIQNKLNKNITRGEFADLVYETIKAVTGMTDEEMNALAKSPGSDNPYQDEYNSKSIRFVYGCGIVNGYPDGSFAENRYITRSEAAKMLVRMADLMGHTMSESGTKYFSDAPYDWSQSYIDKISGISSLYSGLAVMGGDQNGNFVPKGYYTCEQAVATMLRITESVIGQISGYSGGVIEIKNTSISSQTDFDQTGFVPNAWSWVAEGEGYGRQYFTSGKYVRADGRSVLYIESADSPDFFSYQIYTMPDGAKQDAYCAPSSGTQEYWGAQGMEGTLFYAAANNSSDKSAMDTTEGLRFRSGNHAVTIESAWLDELYYQYSTPDGLYTLVREKK